MSHSQPQGQTVAQPGRELRKIREQAGVSLSEIAKKTLISEARLHALENDDYQNVGSAAYVTGYARAYAKVVGFDASQHVTALEAAMGFERERVEASMEPIIPAKPRGKGLQLGMVITLIGFVTGLIALLVVYWADTGSEVPPAARTAPVSEQPRETEARRILGDVATGTRADEVVTTPVMGGGERVPPVNRQQAPSTVISGTLRAREFSEPDNVLPDERSASSAAIESQGVTATQQDSDIGGGNVEDTQLVINFTGECWLRVVDAKGQRLVDTIKKAGDRLSVSGQAPFNIRLGNAGAVAIFYEGEPVAVTPRPGRRTLELSVGS